MIKATTIFGNTQLIISPPFAPFVFADTACLITEIYNYAKEHGFGDDFKEVLKSAINDGTAFGENSKSVPAQVQDIIDKTIKGDKDE